MPPMIDARSLHLECHLTSDARSISHALKVMLTVSVWSPTQPLTSEAVEANRQLKPNSNAASASAERRTVRFEANHAAAITVVKKVSQPRKLPVTIVAAPARQGD